MKENQIINIPFVAHESSMNRMERANKRLMILAIIELFIILITFISIMVYFYLPEEIHEEGTSIQNVENIDNSDINQSIEG